MQLHVSQRGSYQQIFKYDILHEYWSTIFMSDIILNWPFGMDLFETYITVFSNFLKSHIPPDFMQALHLSSPTPLYLISNPLYKKLMTTSELLTQIFFYHKNLGFFLYFITMKSPNLTFETICTLSVVFPIR